MAAQNTTSQMLSNMQNDVFKKIPQTFCIIFSDNRCRSVAA